MMMRCHVFLSILIGLSGGYGCSPPPGDAGPAAADSLPLSPLVQISQSATDSQTFLNTSKCVAVTADGVIHVAWLEIQVAAPFPGHAQQGQITYSRSTDGGQTFSAASTLTPVVSEVGTPKLAAAGNSVFAVWHQSDGQRSQIILGHSDDSGLTWIPYPTPLGPGNFPAIDAWSDGASAPFVHVTWSNSQVPSGVSEVYLANSRDGARTFSAPIRVSSDDGRSSWTPAVSSWGETVHVAWTDERHNVDELGQPYDCGTVGGGPTCHEEEYYRRSQDGGASFPDPELRLTTDPAAMPRYSWAPSIVAWKQTVHLAYFDARTDRFQIYYRKSQDDGRTWVSETSVTGSLDAQPMGGWWRPSLTARNTELRIAFWRQEDESASSAWAVASADEGATFTAPILLSTGTVALQPAAALGADGAAHFVFYDSPSGNQEIFYRRMAARK